MRKKILSLALALALCLSLTVPALAADTLTGNQLYPVGEWGNGPSLTLKGVTGERAVDLELSYCYDVEVGGSLVLDMPFPAGKNRVYTIMPAGVYISPDFSDYADNGQSWDLPAASDGGVFEETSGRTQYVYNFTESDMGQLDGFEKAIYMSVYWDEGTGDYSDDSGSVYFYIHVVPAKASPAGPAGFTDVAADSPYKEAISWAVDQGITNGTSGTTFSPAATCTTRQILTFLYRANGRPGAAAGQNDLDAAVAWAARQGILPDGADSTIACTRAAAVQYIWKAAGSPAPKSAASFSDVAADADYARAVSWAVEKGITNGTGADTFSPDNTCTRGQIVTFLYRASK